MRHRGPTGLVYLLISLGASFTHEAYYRIRAVYEEMASDWQNIEISAINPRDHVQMDLILVHSHSNDGDDVNIKSSSILCLPSSSFLFFTAAIISKTPCQIFYLG